jgi:hypothetical protein
LAGARLTDDNDDIGFDDPKTNDLLYVDMTLWSDDATLRWANRGAVAFAQLL